MPPFRPTTTTKPRIPNTDFFYLAFPRDKRSNKILVYTVYLIELAQTIWLTHDAFAIFGYGFADFSALTKVYFEWLLVPVTSGLGMFFVQMRLRFAETFSSGLHQSILLCLSGLCSLWLSDSPLHHCNRELPLHPTPVKNKSQSASLKIALTSSVAAFVTGAFTFEGAPKSFASAFRVSPESLIRPSKPVI